jgi:hypothetical protein
VLQFEFQLSKRNVCRSSSSLDSIEISLRSSLNSEITKLGLKEYNLRLYPSGSKDKDTYLTSIEIDQVKDMNVPFDSVELNDESIVFYESNVNTTNFLEHIYMHPHLPETCIQYLNTSYDSTSKTTTLYFQDPSCVATLRENQQIWIPRSKLKWTIRIDQSGSFQVRMCNNRDQCLAPSDMFSVTDCSVSADAKAQSFVQAKSSTDLVVDYSQQNQQDLFHLDPVLGFDGIHAHIIPNSAIDTSSSSTTTIGMWLFLAETKTDTFRSLLYKGDEMNGVQRTPSVWLVPNSTRLALKVSTRTHPDVGGESKQGIPPLKWTHVAFIFTNYTTSFEMSIYIDGIEDTTLMVHHDDVESNEYPLRLGKDPFFPGIRGLMAKISIQSGSGKPRLSTLQKQREDLENNSVLLFAIDLLRRQIKMIRDVIVDVDEFDEEKVLDDAIEIACKSSSTKFVPPQLKSSRNALFRVGEMYLDGDVTCNKSDDDDDDDDVLTLSQNITLSKAYFLNATLLGHGEASSILSSIAMMENSTNTLAFLLVSAVTGSVSSHLGIGHYHRRSSSSCEAALYSYRVISSLSLSLSLSLIRRHKNL